MNNKRLIILGVLSVLLSACSTPSRQPAQIYDRQTAAPSTALAGSLPPAVEGPGTYAVKPGDTLYRIALQFGRSYKEIVEWNNLPNANDIKVGQVLKVAPPGGAASPNNSAVQLGSVTSPAVDVRPMGQTPDVATAPVDNAGASGTKIGPRGDKRPYSDANLADMQKPDASGSVSAPIPVAPTPPPAQDQAGDASVQANALDWMWPTDGKISSTFEQNKKGIDIPGRTGQSVNAAAGGKVVYAGTGIRGFGNLVIIKHSNNFLSAYAHNRSILVKEGQTVARGQKIAEMGNSDSDSVKLHFQIRQSGKPVDPAKFLPPR